MEDNSFYYLLWSNLVAMCPYDTGICKAILNYMIMAIIGKLKLQLQVIMAIMQKTLTMRVKSQA